MEAGLLLIVTLDAVLAVAALCSAALARFGCSGVADKLLEPGSAATVAVFVPVLLFSSHLMETYDYGKNMKRWEIFVNVLFGVVTSFALLSIISYLNPDILLGRGVLVISLLLFMLYQFCWHTLYLMGKKNPHFSHRVLVLGTGPLAARIGEMAASNDRNLVLSGYASCHEAVAGDDQGQEEEAVPREAIVGSADDLVAATTRAKADLIVAALSERRGVFPLKDVLKCKLNGIEVMDAPTFYELVHRKLMVEAITPGWFIFSNGFRRSALFRFSKRAVDLVLSAAGLVLTAPFFPLIGLAIKLDSRGRVLFSQLRVGLNEKPFMLYKFRTMSQDAEVRTGAVWAAKNDPRVTRVGRFLRNSRIDELPQLINVLKGEMSFVGPRPERPEFVEELKQSIPFYSKRHFIKPGLTGWAQVRYSYGSSVEDALEKLRYDLYYIKNIRPFLDTLIFFETIKVVLFGRGGR
jgi:sugar transferase (PEP-CTERM system associated)